MKYKQEYANPDAIKDMRSLVTQLSLLLEQPVVNTKILLLYLTEIKSLIKEL